MSRVPTTRAESSPLLPGTKYSVPTSDKKAGSTEGLTIATMHSIMRLYSRRRSLTIRKQDAHDEEGNSLPWSAAAITEKNEKAKIAMQH